MWHQVISLALLSIHSPLQWWLVPSALSSSGCPCRYRQTSVNHPEAKMPWGLAEPAHHTAGGANPLHPSIHRQWQSGGSPGPPLMLPGAWLPCCPHLLPWLTCARTKPVLRLNHRMQDYKVINYKKYSRINCKNLRVSKTYRRITASFQSV